jgi:hypothetical protein
MKEYIVICRECGKERKSSSKNYSRDKKQLCRACSKKGKRNPLHGNTESARKANSMIKNRSGGRIWTNKQKREQSHRFKTDRQINQKLRLARLKDLSNKRISFANYNKNACRLFDEINATMGWSGRHAENGGEVCVRELGYWLDFYEPTLNIVIEFDEKHHKYLTEKDDIRQKEIVEHFGCKFYRLTEDNFTNWKNIIC